MQNKEIKNFGVKMSDDFSEENQPENTYRYMQNGCIEDHSGDSSLPTFENSNEIKGSIPEGYVIIGKTYMRDHNICIFSVTPDNQNSEIGVFNKFSGYKTKLNESDLNFRIDKQVDAIYRLREGCGDTIYFVDDFNRPRTIELSNIDQYYESGQFRAKRLELQKIPEQNPYITEINVDNFGQLPAGSYNFGIQQLDADLNPTEILGITETINIYHDSALSKQFGEIEGSTNEVDTHMDFGLTSKSIKIKVNNLDVDYPYYRVVIIAATSGSGFVTNVFYSREISRNIEFFEYTGTNHNTEGTLEEVEQVSYLIATARHIRQVDNQLLLGDTTDINIDYCGLQKYASKIAADLELKEVVLNDISADSNPKKEIKNIESVGYTPGEIYSFDIVYIVEGNIELPKMHIPGRNPSYPSLMSSDNKLENTYYEDRENCDLLDYWGYDNQSDPLTNKNKRHHRFPLRSEIGIPLYTKEEAEGSSSLEYWNFSMDVQGEVDPSFMDNTVDFVIVYTVGGGAEQEFTGTIDLTTYQSPLENFVSFTEIEEIVVTGIFELDGSGNRVDPAQNTGLEYLYEVDFRYLEETNALYKTEIMGISFTNIEKPPKEITGGLEVIGYKIVRAERKERDRTILDTGVITPLVQGKNKEGEVKYAGYGQTFPKTYGDPFVLEDELFALHFPSHMYDNINYNSFSEIILEGTFNVEKSIAGTSITQDIQPGTSYDSERHKKKERDSDGFDLNIMAKDIQLEYQERPKEIFANQSSIKNVFYLDTMFAKTVTLTDDTRRDVYNLSSDNRICILQLNEKKDPYDINNRKPFVVLKRNMSDPYLDHESRASFAQTDFIPFNTSSSSVTIFKGDSYISPMRHTSSVFFDTRLRLRESKKGVLNFIIAALAVIVGVLVVAGTFGAGAPVGLAIAAAGLALSQASTGFKKSQAAKIYLELYFEGLNNTLKDIDTTIFLDIQQPDDQIQWVLSTMNDLWFESNYNSNWRHGTTLGITDFLNPLTVSNLEVIQRYGLEKLTIIYNEGDSGRNYLGFAYPEFYEINKDYFRRRKEKYYYGLELSHDCCSKCPNEFKNRIYYSEQSFQEERTDNYRVILPNNYTDVPAETGKINHIEVLNNSIVYITEEAIYLLPQNFQERVTGEIISFIGTGEYFNIPPRKIIDDSSGNSYGTSHKWSVTKYPFGLMYVCEGQNAVVQFNGQKIENLSNKGREWFFNNNTEILLDSKVRIDTGNDYPFTDNPSNSIGTGYISVYDPKKERCIITKKDLHIPEIGEDYLLCGKNGELHITENIEQIKQQKSNEGYVFTGIDEDCNLVFEKIVEETVEVEEVQAIPNTADIHLFLDSSGSFGGVGSECIDDINNAIDLWETNYRSNHPLWTGEVIIHYSWTERWITFLGVALNDPKYNGVPKSEIDIILVSFVNEAEPFYHGDNLTSSILPLSPSFTNSMNDHYDDFILEKSQIKSFNGLIYPIVFGEDSQNCQGGSSGNLQQSKVFLQNVFAMLFKTEVTEEQFDILIPTKNQGFSNQEWDIFRTSVTTNFNWDLPTPLKDEGWSGMFDVYAKSDGSIISAERFELDINRFLEGVQSTQLVQKTIQTKVTDKVAMDKMEVVSYNNSWTQSFHLKSQGWGSMMDYMPNIYLSSPDTFFSFLQGNSNIYEHNIKGKYREFYGEKYPFIIDVVVPVKSVSQFLNSIGVYSEAYKYDENSDEYVMIEDFFDSFIINNNTQCTGEIEIELKDNKAYNYLIDSISDNNLKTAKIDINEGVYSFNRFRNYLDDRSKGIWTKNIEKRSQGDRYHDKVLKDNFDFNKDWRNITKLKGKYFTLRLIFNKFVDNKLVLNYFIFNVNESRR